MGVPRLLLPAAPRVLILAGKRVPGPCVNAEGNAGDGHSPALYPMLRPLHDPRSGQSNHYSFSTLDPLQIAPART